MLLIETWWDKRLLSSVNHLTENKDADQRNQLNFSFCLDVSVLK